MKLLLRGLLKLGNLILDLVTNVLSFVGLIGIGLWLSGMLLGTSVILFATGSMSPAIPEGAAVLSINTPAEDLRIGEVVTVPRRQGDLPVSHRIVEIANVDGQQNARALKLKGDANPSPDIDTVTVTEVPRVLFVVPGGAYALQFLGDPRMLIAIGIIVASLMVRAFGGDRIRRWLTRPDSQPEPPYRRKRGSTAVDGDAAEPHADPTSNGAEKPLAECSNVGARSGAPGTVPEDADRTDVSASSEPARPGARHEYSSTIY